MRRQSIDSKAKYKRYLDYLWGTIVVLRADKRCELCYRASKLEAHHYFTRRCHGSVRWDIDVGVCLCHGCHQWKSLSHSETMRDLIIKRIGQKEFENLKIRASMVGKIDFKIWELVLMSELERFIDLPDWSNLSYTKKIQFLRKTRK